MQTAEASTDGSASADTTTDSTAAEPAATTTDSSTTTTDETVELAALEGLNLTSGLLESLTGNSTSMCADGDAECAKLEAAAKEALANAKLA